MNTVFRTYKPDGFTNVNSYLFVQNPFKLIDFLKKSFYATEINRSMNPSNGDISNCILKIGDTCIMISQARGPFKNMKTALYLYVDDVDLVYKRALDHEAKSVFAPADMDYKDRQAGIIDPSGNYWWISRRLVNHGYQDSGF